MARKPKCRGVERPCRVPPEPGERYTLFIPYLPRERQPTGVHTVDRVDRLRDGGVVVWKEGGVSPLQGFAEGWWRRA